MNERLSATSTLRARFHAMHNYLRLPAAAKAEHCRDRSGLPQHDPGVERAVEEGVAWLSRAQDNSASHDGGVARHFSLLTGWGSSYPETTGYIVPTILAYARWQDAEAIRQRASRMLDWLVSIQLPCGGFQGGMIDSKPIVPVAFNTGQILLGLASGAREFGEPYRRAMCRAADWLVEIQDPDGCWRKHPSPFVAPGEKAYDAHAAWGLLEAARIGSDMRYADAALANIRWALRSQRETGWFDRCCLTDPSRALTHTLGYALRGMIEAYRYTNDKTFLLVSRKTAEGLLGAIRDGFLPGRLYANWRGAVPWACLTGSVQIAHCWLLLHQETQDPRYRDAAYAVNRYVRRTMKVDGPPETRGAVKGSLPVSGGYGAYEYLSWACKFSVDANMFEKTVRESERSGYGC
jgi:hypothetical protein